MSLEARSTFDVLTQPHPLAQPLRDGVPEDLWERFAIELIQADAGLLDRVNKLRPRIYLGSPQYLQSPEKDDSFYNDKQALELAAKVGHGVYGKLISAHLANLGLPYIAQPV